MRPSRISRAAIAAKALAAAGLALALAAPQAFAQSVQEFYQGKQIRFLVSTAAGGDYDAWSRLVAAHWGRLIPGNPTFVVQNMPGGGGIVMANHFFNQAPRDGSLVGMIGRNLPLQAILKDPNVRFDPQKWHYVGSPEVSNYVCAVLAGSPAETAQQTFEKEVLLGGAGAGTGTSTIPPLFSRVLGMKLKLVEGYGSSTAASLAMERGEVHGLCQSLTSLLAGRESWIKDGRIKVLFNTESKPIPGLNAPTIFEFAKTDQQRAVLTMFASTTEFGRPILLPPETPADRVAALRKAFEAMISDKDFQEDAAKRKLKVTLVKGEELQAMTSQMAAASPETIGLMQEVMSKK